MRINEGESLSEHIDNRQSQPKLEISVHYCYLAQHFVKKIIITKQYVFDESCNEYRHTSRIDDHICIILLH